MSVLQHSKVNSVIHAREDGPVKNAIGVTRDTLDQAVMFVQKVGFQRRIYLVPCVEHVNRADGEGTVRNVKTVPKTIKTRYVETINGMIQIFIS